MTAVSAGLVQVQLWPFPWLVSGARHAPMSDSPYRTSIPLLAKAGILDSVGARDAPRDLVDEWMMDDGQTLPHPRPGKEDEPDAPSPSKIRIYV